MIKANARQTERKLFDNTAKLKSLVFEDMTYEQAIKLRGELRRLQDKQQFYKLLIKQSDQLKEENNGQTFTR